jgi:hypothetical protein
MIPSAPSGRERERLTHSRICGEFRAAYRRRREIR